MNTKLSSHLCGRLVLLFFFFVTSISWGQTEIFNEAGGGSEPSGWAFVNNVATNEIDRGSYWLVDAGSPSDQIITATYDLSSYASATLSWDAATFGSGPANSALLEISYDGGTTFSETYLSNTPSSSSYIDGGDINLSSISSQVVLRISNNGASGRGVRLRNLILIAFSGNTAPSISNITQTPEAINVTSSDAVSVAADVTDSDGIANVELHWGTTSGSLGNTIAMSMDSGDTYTTDSAIPAQADGVTVYYKIEATDNNASAATNTSAEQNYVVSDPVPAPSLILSEVADPGDTFQARFVEIYNNGGASIDFSTTTVYLARYANNNPTPQTIQLTGTIQSGGFYVIASSQSSFNSSYGFDPNIESGIVSGNGDDTYTLIIGGDFGVGTEFDVYGEPGTDGTGEAWEYEDSRAVRNDLSNSPSDVWIQSQWTIISADVDDMTPRRGEPDYIFDNGWVSGDPSGVATAADNILIANGEATISGTSATNMKSLTIKSGATLNVNDIINVDGDIFNNGSLVFTSTTSNDGELDAFSGTVYGSGTVTVERYMSSNRAYRMISSPINTGAGTINDNWQEGVNNPDTSTNLNPNPGFGTHITGSTTGANGFDATASGNPSLFTVDVANQEFDAVLNTNATTLTAGDAFLLFVRGDRSIDLNSNTSESSTILRTSGQLATGDVTQNFGQTTITDSYIMFGNPYQATVNVNEVFANTGTDNINTTFYYVYDPTIGERGGYVEVDLSDGSNEEGSEANQFLQPGQAAQALVSGTGIDTNIAFQEDDKATGNHTATFTPSSTASSIKLKLYTAENYQNAGPLHDGIGMYFSENFNNQVNTQEDILKAYNFDENLGFTNGDFVLAKERREIPVEGEEFQLFTNQFRHTDYTMTIELSLLAGFEVYLEDTETGESMLLENGLNEFNFSANTTTDENRFKLRIGKEILSVNDNLFFENIKLYPNPLSEDGLTIFAPQLLNKEVQIEFSDVAGRIINDELLYFSDKNEPIVVNSMLNGLYLVTIRCEGNTYTEKLIKQ